MHNQRKRRPHSWLVSQQLLFYYYLYLENYNPNLQSKDDPEFYGLVFTKAGKDAVELGVYNILEEVRDLTKNLSLQVNQPATAFDYSKDYGRDNIGSLAFPRRFQALNHSIEQNNTTAYNQKLNEYNNAKNQNMPFPDSRKYIAPNLLATEEVVEKLAEIPEYQAFKASIANTGQPPYKMSYSYVSIDDEMRTDTPDQSEKPFTKAEAYRLLKDGRLFNGRTVIAEYDEDEDPDGPCIFYFYNKITKEKELITGTNARVIGKQIFAMMAKERLKDPSKTNEICLIQDYEMGYAHIESGIAEYYSQDLKNEHGDIEILSKHALELELALMPLDNVLNSLEENKKISHFSEQKKNLIEEQVNTLLNYYERDYNAAQTDEEKAAITKSIQFCAALIKGRIGADADLFPEKNLMQQPLQSGNKKSQTMGWGRLYEISPYQPNHKVEMQAALQEIDRQTHSLIKEYPPAHMVDAYNQGINEWIAGYNVYGRECDFAINLFDEDSNDISSSNNPDISTAFVTFAKLTDKHREFSYNKDVVNQKETKNAYFIPMSADITAPKTGSLIYNPYHDTLPEHTLDLFIQGSHVAKDSTTPITVLSDNRVITPPQTMRQYVKNRDLVEIMDNIRLSIEHALPANNKLTLNEATLKTLCHAILILEYFQGWPSGELAHIIAKGGASLDQAKTEDLMIYSLSDATLSRFLNIQIDDKGNATIEVTHMARPVAIYKGEKVSPTESVAVQTTLRVNVAEPYPTFTCQQKADFREVPTLSPEHFFKENAKLRPNNSPSR